MLKLASLMTGACMVAAMLPTCPSALAQAHSPLRLVQKDTMLTNIQGHFDHLAVDLPGNRIYAAAESAHQVLIFNLNSGKYLGSIGNIIKPHAVLVRPGIHRIFVTDGGRGQVRVYDSQSHKLVKVIPLHLDADSIRYNPQSHHLFVVNGDAHESYSTVSVINTSTEQKVADIRIGGGDLEAMAIDPKSNRMYVNDPAKSTIVVVNRKTRRIEASWPVTLGHENVAMALDAAHHRLFVACRSGELVVFNTRTGKQIRAMPIDKDVDDASFNPATGRIYAQCGEPGATWVYRENSPDTYALLGKIEEGYKAKNSALVPRMHRYFVLVPPDRETPGHIDEFATR